MTDSGPAGYLDRKFDESDDIGGGVRIRPFTAGDPPHEAGVFVMHRHADGKLCMGTVMFDTPENAGFDRVKWTVVCREPLTLQPSIHQVECGLHGFIENGRWRGV